MARAKNKRQFTQKELHEVLDYNSDTGIFTWKSNYRRAVLVGSVAGHVGKNGYREIYVFCGKYMAARLAWFYVHGEWPEEIDHKNCVRDDNRIENLRNCTHMQNSFNRRLNKNNTTGHKGVAWWTRGRFVSNIRFNGKNIRLGIFDTAQEAAYFYNYANSYYHGEFGRVV